ncbi:MAG: hypothetical protein NUV54_02005, partial [Candidatus Taylorbacteria bacterium]|nr:hypothetical protein [Candidatus Taylorbacteria bacterium]
MESHLKRLVQSIEKPGPSAVVFVERAYMFARKWYLTYFDDGERILARAVESAEYVGSCGLGALALS